MGLYTQQDPIGIAGGLNLYGYANGDPVNFSDPFGLTACDDPPCRTLALTLGVGGSLQVFAQGLTVSASVGLRLSVRHPQVFMQFDGGMGMGMGLYVGGGTQVGLQTMTVNPETDLIEDGNSVGVFGQGNLGAGESVGLTGSATLDSSGTVNAGANGSFRYGGGIGAGVMAGATVSHVEASRSLWDILKESAQRFTSTFITGEHD
jgi:uncharacterized protein RhaS with RHS repeats